MATAKKPIKRNVKPIVKSTANKNHVVDITIIGAGPAGLSTARAASKLGLTVAIIEKQKLESIASPKYDGREIALTHRSKHILTDLDMWNKIPEDEISKIESARVYNGEDGDFMGLKSDTAKQLSYIVSNHYIRQAAYNVVAKDKNIKIYTEQVVRDIKISDHNAIVETEDGQEFESKLLIAADSRFSDIRTKVGLNASKYNFEKTMIVCRMAHEKPHNYIANECFHTGHTMAVLPLNNNQSSVVLTLKHDDAKIMMAMSDEEFNAWVMKHYHYKLGDMKLVGARYPYPLVGVYAEEFTSKRFALMGDAAVGMHPVTAHGFNFGLTGIEFLMKSIARAMELGLDIGSRSVLDEFEKNHQRATLPLYLGTAAIVKLYTNDHPAAQVARKLLIRVADKMNPIKSYMMNKLVDDETAKPLPLPVPMKLLKLLRN